MLRVHGTLDGTGLPVYGPVEILSTSIFSTLVKDDSTDKSKPYMPKFFKSSVLAA